MQSSVPVFKQPCASHSCQEWAAPGLIYCELHKCFPASVVKNPIKCTTKFCTDDCVPARDHCSVHLYKSNGPICEHGDCRTTITPGKRYCYSHEHHVAAVGELLRSCESLFCEEKCAADSIYCLTHTCFPEQIVFNAEYIEDQKKIEEQIKTLKHFRVQERSRPTYYPTSKVHYTHDEANNSDIMARLSAPLGYVTADVVYDKYHSKYQNNITDTVPRYSLYEECQKAYDEARAGTGPLLDPNRICIRSHCQKSSMFYGKVCVEHKCLFCHEAAVQPINVCLFHLPPSLIHCVGHNVDESVFLSQCYLVRLPSNALTIIVDIIRNNQETSVGYLGVD